VLVPVRVHDSVIIFRVLLVRVLGSGGAGERGGDQ
jgi:hypothetical protein